MTLTVDAVYRRGQLKLKNKVALPEGTPVRVTITPLTADDDPLAGVIGIGASGRSDGAENHDHYIYGTKKAPMIFVDTWAWIALADKSDPYHRKAKAAHRKLAASRRKYVTSDYVVGEAITFLYDAIGPASAQGFVNTLLAATDAGSYSLVHVTPSQFRRAWKLRQKFHDKPDISFTDFTSMVLMQEMGIVDVFSGDAHFVQVGLGFRLVP